ncbi:MAG: amidohydrolase family protein, partial [bacterium]|nr:amidohydrolase family protein [bacterium]
GAAVYDCGGRLLMPSFIDPHTHLDKAFLETPREAEGLMDAVFLTMDYQKSVPAGQIQADVLRRGARVLDMELQNGSALVRSHVSVDEIWGMEAFYASCELRRRYAGRVDVQLSVPFNAAFEGAWDEAVRAGEIDYIAGYPTVTPDPHAAVDELFRLAEKYALPLDLHVDESDAADISCFRYVLEKTIRHGMQGRVNCSHVTALAAVPDAEAEEAIALCARAGVSVIALPSCNMFLMGRGDRGLVRRGVTRIAELEQAGVNVAIASDNIRDPFRPFGNGDPLEEALLACQILSRGTERGFRSVLDMITVNAARTSGRPDADLSVGRRADVVLLDAPDAKQAVIENAARLLVVKDGRVVAGTKTGI